MKKITVILMSALLMLSLLTSCTNKNSAPSNTPLNDSSDIIDPEADTGNMPTIVWGFTNSNNDFSLKGETEIFKDFQQAIREKAGVNVEFKSWPDNQSFELALASGDLPDLFTVSKDYVSALLTGKHVMPLDDHLTMAPNLEDVSSIRLEAMRKYFSNGDGKLYFWTPYVGTEAMGSDCWNGMTIRWDYYAELGYPEVKTEDDFLSIVKQAVDAHPVTEDGKKVYGAATFSDGTLWGWWIRGCLYGFHNITDAYSLDIRDGKNEIINNFTNLESPVWRDIEYYFKANQMGIFDPDSLTMKGDDLNTKASNGQLAATICSSYGGTLKDNELAKNPESLAEFLVLPIEGQYNWSNIENHIGWSFYHAVSAKTKDIESCMKVIDYVNTLEGTRMSYVGKEGRIWEYVEGSPKIKQEFIDIRLKGGDASRMSTGGLWAGTSGMSGSQICEDGYPADLWYSPDIWKLTLSPAKKDFCKHYGVEIPSDQVRNLIEEGIAYDKSSMDSDLLSLLPNSPRDITRIDSRTIDIMINAIPRLVLAADRAEFDSIQQETVRSMEEAGVRSSIDWWKSQEQEIKSFLDTVR